MSRGAMDEESLIFVEFFSLQGVRPSQVHFSSFSFRESGHAERKEQAAA